MIAVTASLSAMLYYSPQYWTSDNTDAMDRLDIQYGTSICYTRDNIETVTSDEFLRLIASKGAHFGFYFHYMPVGNNAVPELMPTAEQRRQMIDRIRYVRSADCDIPLPMIAGTAIVAARIAKSC